MAQSRIPRRPAMLSPMRAEALVGDEDPAAASAVAHTSAWALMGVPDDEFGPEVVERLRALVEREGVDAVAHLWSSSPDFTLPGAFWRLYLLLQWFDRDPALVRSRYEDGECAAIIPGLEHPVDVRPLDSVMDEVAALLHGGLTDDDLQTVLADASRAMRILAAGEGGGASWIVDPNDPLAHPVTTRARALLATAEELDDAARRASTGALE